MPVSRSFPAVRTSQDEVVAQVPESPRTSESLQKRRTFELVTHAPGSIGSTRVSAEASEKAEEVAYEDSFPEGGKGWVVVLGCFIYSAATIGWGYVSLRGRTLQEAY